MWIYLFNVITIPIYSRIFKNRKVFAIVVCLQLFLILALRSTTLGVDLPNYNGGYEYISKLGFGELMAKLSFFNTADLVYPYDYESGYVVLNWLSSHLGFSFHGFLVVCAFICIGSIGWFIYKYSKKPWLSFVIFSAFGFFIYDFGIIRQALALSMILLSYIFFDKKRRFSGILSFIIAFCFHRAAIIALPLLIVRRLKSITKKRFIVLLLLSIPLLLLSGTIYDNFITNTMSFAGKGYVGHDVVINNMILLLLGVSLLVFFFFDFSKIKDKVESVACYALIFAVYFSIFGLYNDVLARALQFYSIFLVILIPSVFEQYKDQKVTHVFEIIVYFLLIGFMCYYISGSSIDPYVFNQGGFL